MSVVSCVASLAPFQDPSRAVNVESLLSRFQQRLDVECLQQSIPLPPSMTSFERHSFHLLFILQCTNYDVEQSVSRWIAWVRWRREVCADDIAVNDDWTHHERDAGLATWPGMRDRAGRHCCVVTGRLFDVSARRMAGADARSFQARVETTFNFYFLLTAILPRHPVATLPLPLRLTPPALSLHHLSPAVSRPNRRGWVAPSNERVRQDHQQC